MDAAQVAGRDFLMPWNIAQRVLGRCTTSLRRSASLFPFNAEPIDQFVAKYKGAQDVPIFQVEARRSGYLHQQSARVS